jgi:oligopeptide transport system ATP-binding protein|tara:strand:+ start:39 stop:1064 length:1026 start_codon:yes stop_codon:yes gene_type:complete
MTEPSQSNTTDSIALIEVNNLKKTFPGTRGVFSRTRTGDVKAVQNVSFDVNKGETLGLVGESGCGKSTIGRCILKLEEPTDGTVDFDGKRLNTINGMDLRNYRRRAQAVFQDPFSSLNPRMTVEQIVGEPLLVHGLEKDTKERRVSASKILDLCGLPRRILDSYPHEMSGGQRQRTGIARALILNPDFILCDEAVSALDVSIQAQIIKLLEDLRNEFGLTYLFIAHDLSVVRHISHRVAVMYLGRIVELAEANELFENPKHPYTQALLSAVPIPDPAVERTRRLEIIEGEIPSPVNPPSGCVFHPRCPLADDTCRVGVPDTIDLGTGHLVACKKVDQLELH